MLSDVAYLDQVFSTGYFSGDQHLRDVSVLSCGALCGFINICPPIKKKRNPNLHSLHCREYLGDLSAVDTLFLN